MLALIDPKVWLAFGLACLLSFGGGYLYHAHNAQVTQAGAQATATTATKTITVTDKAAVTRLTSQLAAAKDKASALESLINEARNATPIPIADCRMPDRVRDAINADLATFAP